MAFTNTDILTLAKAGFTAEQIAALNMVGTQLTPQPTPQPQPTPAPQPQPTPATQPQPTPAPQPQPTPAPQPQPTPAPQPQTLSIMATPQPQAATVDDVLKAINGLSTTMQNGFLQGAAQPTPPTAETILAEIINPPSKDKK